LRKQIIKKDRRLRCYGSAQKHARSFQLESGDAVTVIETSDGLLITPFGPDFATAIAAYEHRAKKYRNALRPLAN
jgi:hypothetical protein